MILNGIVKMQGADCYYLTFNNPAYHLITYTTQVNETSLSLAKKLHLNFYAILENNPKLSITCTIKTGTTLTIPSDYASKMELYVQKDKFYPVCMRIYDSKGLYEEYTFNDVVINQAFKDIDFSADNPKYGF
jgi:outer membrane lipoprotein-sorting protein